MVESLATLILVVDDTEEPLRGVRGSPRRGDAVNEASAGDEALRLLELRFPISSCSTSTCGHHRLRDSPASVTSNPSPQPFR